MCVPWTDEKKRACMHCPLAAITLVSILSLFILWLICFVPWGGCDGGIKYNCAVGGSLFQSNMSIYKNYSNKLSLQTELMMCAQSTYLTMNVKDEFATSLCVSPDWTLLEEKLPSLIAGLPPELRQPIKALFDEFLTREKAVKGFLAGYIGVILFLTIGAWIFSCFYPARQRSISYLLGAFSFLLAGFMYGASAYLWHKDVGPQVAHQEISQGNIVIIINSDFGYQWWMQVATFGFHGLLSIAWFIFYLTPLSSYEILTVHPDETANLLN